MKIYGLKKKGVKMQYFFFVYEESIDDNVLELALQGKIEYQLETHEMIPTREKMYPYPVKGIDTLIWQSDLDSDFYYQIVPDDYDNYFDTED